MKLVLVSTLLMFMSHSAFALAAGDQDVTVFSCESAEPYPDKVINLKVIEGGFTGLTFLKVEESLVWGSRKTSFIVRLSTSSTDDVLTYSGTGASLRIYINDLDDQGRYSAFFSKKKSKGDQTEALKCLEGR